jgi:hypothetical protein
MDGGLTALGAPDVEATGCEVHVVPAQGDKLAGPQRMAVGHQNRGRVAVPMSIVPSRSLQVGLRENGVAEHRRPGNFRSCITALAGTSVEGRALVALWLPPFSRQGNVAAFDEIHPFIHCDSGHRCPREFGG